jgi:hypothetical protein
MRTCGADRALIFANFSEAPQTVSSHVFEDHPIKEKRPVYGTGSFLADKSLSIAPLGFLVFTLTQS